MVSPAEARGSAPTDAAGILLELRDQLIADPSIDLLQAEGPVLAAKDAVLDIYLEQAAAAITQRHGQPYGHTFRHGYLLGYRAVRYFHERQGFIVPSPPNVTRVNHLLEQAQNQTHRRGDCVATFRALYGEDDIVAALDLLSDEGIKDGASRIFILFRPFLTGEQQAEAAPPIAGAEC